MPEFAGWLDFLAARLKQQGLRFSAFPGLNHRRFYRLAREMQMQILNL